MTERIEEAAASSKPAADGRPSELGGSILARRITLRDLRAATEIEAIRGALEETRWNRRRAAELLGISYRGLLYKIRRHNLTVRQSGS